MWFLPKKNESCNFSTLEIYLKKAKQSYLDELQGNIKYGIKERLEIIEVFHHPNTSRYEFLLQGAGNNQILGTTDISYFSNDIDSWRATYSSNVGNKLSVVLSSPCSNPNVSDTSNVTNRLACLCSDVLISQQTDDMREHTDLWDATKRTVFHLDDDNPGLIKQTALTYPNISIAKIYSLEIIGEIVNLT